jgi:hypothetical protein
MKLKGFFQSRLQAAAAGQRPGPTSAEVAPQAVEPEPLSSEELMDIQKAWAELAQAAREAGVTNFHACGRGGHHWSEKASSIRHIANLMRNLPRGEAADD